MSNAHRFVPGAFVLGALLLTGNPAMADAPPPASPSPAPAATAAPPSDPCGSILSIVNRPTFGTGVCTVRTGKFDVENGYTNTVTTGPGGGVTATYPQTLVRIGTFDPHLDVEAGLPIFNLTNAGGLRSSGWSDFSVGAKYELGYTDKALWGANAVVTIPTGIHGFSAGNAQYTGNFNWGYTFNSFLSAAGTVGFNALSANNAAGQPQSYFTLSPSILLSGSLPGPSAIEAEYAYFTAAGPGLGGKSWFDFVYVHDLGPHVQLDGEYGFSPTVINGQKQHYIGFGLSFMN